MKRVLILAGAPMGWLDRSACEVANSIAAHRDANDVIIVGAIELATASWSHRPVGGQPNTTVRMKDGRRIETAEIGAVLNLARSVPTMFLRGFTCRVINGVDNQGPSGLSSPDRWARLATRCGIDTPLEGITTGNRLLSQRLSQIGAHAPSTIDASKCGPSANVTVVGDRVFGAVSPMHARQCRRLARAAGCELLGLTFAAHPNRTLLSADPFPSLVGDVADAVARMLCDRAAAASERVA